jgi:hypothetical protein
MDLKQQKLTAEEWESLEKPVEDSEMRILKLIKNGFDDVNVSYNDTQSLITYVRASENIEMHHEYFYNKYFKKQIGVLQKKYFPDKVIFQKLSKKKQTALKKKEIIRLANIDKKITDIRSQIVEFVLLDLIGNFFKNYSVKKKSDDTYRKAYNYYYTLGQIIKFGIRHINKNIFALVSFVLENFKQNMKRKQFIKYAYNFIEQNKHLEKYADIHLYEHQKQIFTACKSEEPKLILYQAPTGTGKTLTPIGLVSELQSNKQRRIIFVCAAKHVGLQLAKSCISMNIKIAVAFGCHDPSGIRLHYFAAKDYTKNRRTGGIFRVDNSVGDNVQIIISDIQSYLPSMRYMLAFNKPKDIIWYWDEPTITLDYKTHEYHEILRNNWQENEIPNIILSSATLPRKEDIYPCVQNYISKFNSTNILNIVSHDCQKTIPILDINGHIVLPHLIYKDFKTLKKSLKHLNNYKTLLRHFDLHCITAFIMYVNKHVDIKDRYKIENYFEDIGDINSINIKLYYLKLLGSLKDSYEQVYKYFKENTEPMFNSSIKLTTGDSYTLTDGPTIYMAENVDKIAYYCLKIAKIPEGVLDMIMKSIEENETVRMEIQKLEQELEKFDVESEKNLSKRAKGQTRVQKSKKAGKTTEKYSPEKELKQQIAGLKTRIRPVELDNEFIPNSHEHLRKFDKLDWLNKSFKPEVEEQVVEKIMLLEVDAIWKVLLLMGVGVFTNSVSRDYIAIMKQLAQKQKLYLIIADTDYIYGTNYQFCHGYVGKDLENLTQEKLIQALGRVGRRNTKADYSIRLRSDQFIDMLFMKSQNTVEVDNMNRLFA